MEAVEQVIVVRRQAYCPVTDCTCDQEKSFQSHLSPSLIEKKATIEHLHGCSYQTEKCLDAMELSNKASDEDDT
jgi:hypothetical protein